MKRIIAIALIIALASAVYLSSPTYAVLTEGVARDIPLVATVGVVLIMLPFIIFSKQQKINKEFGWIEAKVSMKASIFVPEKPPLFIVKIIEENTIYSDPNKQHSIRKIYIGEHYGVFEEKEDSGILWYKIRYKSD